MGEYDQNIDEFDQKTTTTTNINHEKYATLQRQTLIMNNMLHCNGKH